MERKINFIIIGAQKAGTTFLHNILNTSNDIYIPLEKELPFFLEDNIDDESYKKFFLKYFNKSKPNQIIGTSTPQYMMYPNSFSNIKERLPDVKLIVVLREPIKRLISHYDMVYRFGKGGKSSLIQRLFKLRKGIMIRREIILNKRNVVFSENVQIYPK